MSYPVGIRCGLFDIGDLVQQRPITRNAVGAVSPRHVAADVVDTDVGRSHQEQRSGIGEPAATVNQVQAPDEVLVAAISEIGGVAMGAPSKVATGDLNPAIAAF